MKSKKFKKKGKRTRKEEFLLTEEEFRRRRKRRRKERQKHKNLLRDPQLFSDYSDEELDFRRGNKNNDEDPYNMLIF